MGESIPELEAPWDLIKNNPDYAAAIILIEVNLVKLLALLLYPIVPNSSEAIYQMLGLDSPKIGEMKEINFISLGPGHEIRKPRPLFKKLPPDFLERLEEIIGEARSKAEAKRPKIPNSSTS
jgi:Methionyl-tRNA synthetase